MPVSYDKLWKMLIDQNMNKRELAEKSGVSTASIAKLSKGANITTDVLLKICETLDCTLEDIMETVKDSLSKGEPVYLRGFGSFIVKKRAQKTARNISKETTIIIPAHNIPAFKPAKTFMNNVK